jgi:hypothetical protein
MNAIPAYREERHPAKDATKGGRTGLLVLVASAYSECTCPDDCDRDHENE